MGKIKGWKRNEWNSAGFFEWINIHSGNGVIVRISNSPGLEGQYVIQRAKSSGTLTPIAYPTKDKSIALKRATAYMRSHPNG